MIILGVDPALTVTGYGAINVKKNVLSLLEAGIIKTSSKDPLPVRLNKIFISLRELISEIKPQVIVLEKLYAHYRHPTTAYLLGQARGVTCLVSAIEGIPLFEYAATRVKKAIVGAGLASKQQVQRMVVGLLGISEVPSYTDITDALALAIAHSYIAKLNYKQKLG